MIHRVLIVDDEMRILQSLYGLLSEAFSFEIYRASSALDAQKLLMQMQFDLVITDISMPGMNGLELLKSIKRTWPRTYVILLTVYSSFEYAYEANKYDRVEYLLKIESYDEILKTVRRTVEAIEAERAQEMLHLQNELELRAVNGEGSLEAASTHPRASGLTSYLGMGQLRWIDQSEQPVLARPGDRFLLMSDGVYNALSEQELCHALALEAPKAAKALGQMVSAKAWPGQDNYTAVILQC